MSESSYQPYAKVTAATSSREAADSNNNAEAIGSQEFNEAYLRLLQLHANRFPLDVTITPSESRVTLMALDLPHEGPCISEKYTAINEKGERASITTTRLTAEDDAVVVWQRTMQQNNNLDQGGDRFIGDSEYSRASQEEAERILGIIAGIGAEVEL